MRSGTYTVLGTSDYPVCDCCGKTNLVRAVVLACGYNEPINVGVICASKLLRQRDGFGKTYKASPDAILSMGKRANRGELTKLIRS